MSELLLDGAALKDRADQPEPSAVPGGLEKLVCLHQSIHQSIEFH